MKLKILGVALIVRVNGDDEYGDKKDGFSDHLELRSLDGFENERTEWNFLAGSSLCWSCSLGYLGTGR